MRQPDIEIYIKDADRQQVRQWLEQRLGSGSPWQERGPLSRCQVQEIPVIWLAGAVGKWNSLLLDSDQTPWADDLGCAQDAFATLQVEIRCSPGSWQEDEKEEDADRWISVSAQGVREILWRAG